MRWHERLQRIANWLEHRDCIHEARDLSRLSSIVEDIQEHQWAVAFGPGLQFSLYRIRDAVEPEPLTEEGWDA